MIEQASRYNLTLHCPFVVVTNGFNTFCFEIDFETGENKQLKDLPAIEQS